METSRPERVGDSVLALVLAAALVAIALVDVARRGGVLRDDTPRPPRFRRLVLDPSIAPVGLLPVLPGVGPVMAQRIDEERRRMPFCDAEDLLRVHGIGPATLEALRPHIRFGPWPGALRAREDVGEGGAARGALSAPGQAPARSGLRPK